MKMHLGGVAFGAAMALAGLAATCRAQTPTASQPGLLGLLKSDEQVYTALDRWNLSVLEDYIYKKNGVGFEQRSAYKAVSSLRRLRDPKIPARQRQEALMAVARGIDRVLAILKTPEDLMNLAAELVMGSAHSMNMLEYWGEDPLTQAQLNPIATAVIKVYDAGIKAAEAKAAELEKQITAANQSTVGKLWEATEGMVNKGKYNFYCAHYPLALSMDSAKPAQVKACDDGVAGLKEFEDESYGIQAGVRNHDGKDGHHQGQPAGNRRGQEGIPGGPGRQEGGVAAAL